LLQPGQTLGIVGGGQLGRMLARVARQEGFKVVVYTDEYPPSPAGQLADREINAPYFDPEATADFAKSCDVVTLEFENIPAEFMEAVSQRVEVHPRHEALLICQNREREKNFLREHGVRHAEFEVVDDAASLSAALKKLDCACMLKTAAFGYDGKGQVRLRGDEDAEEVWAAFGAGRAVVERLVDFEREISVVGARSADGQYAAWPPVENQHREQILDVSIAPARITETMAADAVALAEKVAEALEYVGVLAVEMFVEKNGTVLVNEIAPRPHNSGHHTLDACFTSQFAQQLRTTAGMPLGSTEQHSPAVMVNLLGDLWHPETGAAPDWSPILHHPRAQLHLYGKRTARPRRKMGHFTVLGDDVETLLSEVEEIRAALGMLD